MLQRFYSSVNRAPEHREKETFTIQDAQDSKAFDKKPPFMLQPEGIKLKLESISQVDYIVTMSKLNEKLPNKIYKIPSCGVDQVMSFVFNKVE